MQEPLIAHTGGPAAEGSSCRTSVTLSLQVQHRRTGLRERGREAGVAAILDFHCAGVFRLAADDAMPPDRVGVGFQPRGERVDLFVGLEDEVFFAGVRQHVAGRAEFTPGSIVTSSISRAKRSVSPIARRAGSRDAKEGLPEEGSGGFTPATIPRSYRIGSWPRRNDFQAHSASLFMGE